MDPIWVIVTITGGFTLYMCYRLIESLWKHDITGVLAALYMGSLWAAITLILLFALLVLR